MSKQSKWLIGLVMLLVVINLALVASIWLKKDQRVAVRSGDAKDYLVEQLSMSPSQVNSFDSLRKDHFERMKRYQEDMRHLKDALFKQLNDPSAKPDSIAQLIGLQQTKIDMETFDHFSKLRALLNEDQKGKFDRIIQDVLRTMGPKGAPPPGGRPGDGQGPPPPDGPPH